MQVAETGYDECLNSLVKSGADVNVCNKKNCTALFRTVQRQQVKCVKILVDAGADLNTKNLHGRSPLMEAVWNNDVKCLEILLQAGADEYIT